MTNALKFKLQVLWQPIGKWGLTSLSKGFCEFIFLQLMIYGESVATLLALQARVASIVRLTA